MTRLRTLTDPDHRAREMKGMRPAQERTLAVMQG
jgi:hypothetical protein